MGRRWLSPGTDLQGAGGLHAAAVLVRELVFGNGSLARLVSRHWHRSMLVKNALDLRPHG
jgi:hypothetical protein